MLVSTQENIHCKWVPFNSSNDCVTANKDMPTTLAAINGIINLDCNFKSAGDYVIVAWKWGISREISHESEEGLTKTEGTAVSTIYNDGTYAAIQIMNLSLQDAGLVTCSRFFAKAGTSETCNWIVYVQGGILFISYVVTSSMRSAIIHQLLTGISDIS